jgi:hypothetical protein
MPTIAPLTDASFEREMGFILSLFGVVAMTLVVPAVRGMSR